MISKRDVLNLVSVGEKPKYKFWILLLLTIHLRKFLKILGATVGTILVAGFLKGRMVAGAQAANQHTFWTKLFKIKVPNLPNP